MQPEFLPDLTPILVWLIGKQQSMCFAIRRVLWTTNLSTSLLLPLSPSSPILMLIMVETRTMASPLVDMWSRLGLERFHGAPSCSLWLPCPQLKQSTSLLLRRARRSSGCVSSWGSLATASLDLHCSEWTINRPLQRARTQSTTA